MSLTKQINPHIFTARKHFPNTAQFTTSRKYCRTTCGLLVVLRGDRPIHIAAGGSIGSFFIGKPPLGHVKPSGSTGSNTACTLNVIRSFKSSQHHHFEDVLRCKVRVAGDRVLAQSISGQAVVQSISQRAPLTGHNSRQLPPDYRPYPRLFMAREHCTPA